MIVRIKDLQQAEEALDESIEELRSYSRDPDRWSAHERLDDDDKRVMVLHKAHFERIEALQRRVEGAANNLRGLQATFAGEQF